jgi:signal peptidase I
MKSRSPIRGIGSALIILLMAAIWISFAPSQFGGKASYVIVAGASMQPTVQRGDLVITEEKQEYQVGDIVTYRHHPPHHRSGRGALRAEGGQ